MNVKPETIKLLEENGWRERLEFHIGSDFLDLTPKAKATKSKNKYETTSN